MLAAAWLAGAAPALGAGGDRARRAGPPPPEPVVAPRRCAADEPACAGDPTPAAEQAAVAPAADASAGAPPATRARPQPLAPRRVRRAAAAPQPPPPSRTDRRRCAVCARTSGSGPSAPTPCCPRLRAPFEPIERAVERRDRRPGRRRAAPSSPGRRPRHAQLRVLPGAAAALLVLLMISLLRGWGDAVIAIEYPSELRGTFSVHLSRSQAGRAPASAHQQPERGAARPAPGAAPPAAPITTWCRARRSSGRSGPGAGGSPSTATCSRRAARR